MRIGVLTGGGDCPGLNAVIRALVRRGEREFGHEFVGFRHGWRGVMENEAMPLSVATTRGLIHRGGTILGTSRTNPFKDSSAAGSGGVDAVLATLMERDIDALVAIGGEDTLGRGAQAGGATPGARQRRGGGAEDDRQRLVGHRRDVWLRHRGADCQRRDRSVAHHRREPRPSDDRGGDGSPRRMDRAVVGPRAAEPTSCSCRKRRSTSTTCARDCSAVTRPGRASRSWSSPRARCRSPGRWRWRTRGVDEFGHVRLGGIGNVLAPEIEQRTGFETRVTVLGHVLRGARRPRSTASSRRGSGWRPRPR